MATSKYGCLVISACQNHISDTNIFININGIVDSEGNPMGSVTNNQTAD